MTMPYGEAWLLETLSMSRVWISLLASREQVLRAQLNRGFHRLSRSELKKTLVSLFARGDIEAYTGEARSGFTPTTSELESALEEQYQYRVTYCGVTKQGGMRWEALARPDWSRYVQDRGWNGETVEITAGSRPRLLEVVANAETLWLVSMDETSLDVQQLAPWDPLPWKQLPQGFRAIICYKDVPYVYQAREELEAEHRKRMPRHLRLRNWATSICGHAYV